MIMIIIGLKVNPFRIKGYGSVINQQLAPMIPGYGISPLVPVQTRSDMDTGMRFGKIRMGYAPELGYGFTEFYGKKVKLVETTKFAPNLLIGFI